MKYTDEEKKIIDEVKKYLRELRLINIEKLSYSSKNPYGNKT